MRPASRATDPGRETPAGDVFSRLARSFAVSKRWISLTYILLLSQAALIATTFRDYGIIWDEEWHASYGEHIISWYASLFQDARALSYWNLIYYGGFFDVAAQAATRVSPIGPFETRHLLSALCGLLGVVAAYKLGRYLAGPLAGFLSALFLALTPVYYGHSFNNPKDIPFAVLFLVSLYYLIVSIERLPRVPIGLLIKLGVATGLALGVRIGGALLVGYIAFAFCVWLMSRRLARSPQPAARLDSPGSLRALDPGERRNPIAVFAPRYLLVIAIAYVIMLACWPWAQVQPLLHPMEGFRMASRFDFSNPVLFEGQTVSARDLPWHYLIKWFLISLPEFYFIGLAIGVLLLAARLRHRQPSPRGQGRAVEYLVLVTSVVAPVAFAAATRATLYDGLRHFLFVVPPLAVIGAVSLATLIQQRASRSSRLAAWVVIASLTVSGALTALDMAQLHPNEYIYFNRVFGGGLSEAAKSFETDYWGNTYKEGAEWIAKNYRREDGAPRLKVASCSYPLSTTYYLPSDRFEYVGSFDHGDPRQPDLFLATTRWDCHDKLPGRVVHAVTRQGVPLLYVKEVQPSE